MCWVDSKLPVSMQNYIPGNVASIWSDILTRVKTRVLGVESGLFKLVVDENIPAVF